MLVTALLLVVDSGVNLKGENYLASHYGQTVTTDNAHAEKAKEKETTSREQENRIYYSYIDKIREFKRANPAFYWVLVVFVMSLPLYLFFRKSPNIPDMRFSELFIAMVYIWAMCYIYEIVLTFFSLYDQDDTVLYCLCVIPLKQLSGFKWWRTALYLLLSFIAVTAIFYCGLVAAAQIQIYLDAM